MQRLITVAPAAAGWSIQSDAFSNSMMFGSGAQAEAAARCLGRDLARAGCRVELRIHLRDGTLGGSTIYHPARSWLAMAG